MDRASVHVVIVNWNSGAQLADCLQSFAAVAQDDVATRVTVVDNASTDGSCEQLAVPPIVPLAVVRNAENRGFAAACNQGASGSDADFLLFLNPDTRLMPGSFSGPASYLQAAENVAVGILGIHLFDTAGQIARTNARTQTAWS